MPADPPATTNGRAGTALDGPAGAAPDARAGVVPSTRAGVAFDARVTADGRAVLGPAALALRTELDRLFAGWGGQVGAAELAYPPLLAADDLVPLDYFQNFPHLTSLVAGVRPEAAGAGLVVDGHLTGDAASLLDRPGHVLPSAACYSAYLDLADHTLTDPVRITTVATCFRREQHYDGLRRLFGFTMREIVCVGPREAVLDHLRTFKDRIRVFFDRLGLPYQVEAATDPFFDPNGARTLMQKLFPVKEEFLYHGDLAIASVNFHRNFFGERCRIRLADGDLAFTGCVAFGLERWLAALHEHFAGDPDRALAAVRAAGSDRADVVPMEGD